MLTASTSEAYSFLLLVLCDPGDAILVPEPSYPLFEQLARLASVRTLSYRIAYDGAWHLDLASLPSKKQLRELRVRATFAVSPNNPTGNVLKENELDALRQLDLPLIVDEVFRPFCRLSSDSSPADPLAMAEQSHLTVILDGLSKRCCSPDLKLGWLVAQGQRAPELWERLEWVSDTYLSVAGPVQQSLPALLNQQDEIQECVNRRLLDNLRSMKELLSNSPASLLPSEGGWSAIVRLPNTRSENSWWSALAEQGIWVHPGSLYQLPFECALVVSLLTPHQDLERAMILLGRVLENE